MNKPLTWSVIVLLSFACKEKPNLSTTKIKDASQFAKNSFFDTTIKTIHVFVALCDNKYQGIVPVPAKIGNGQDPANNLYWGCSF
ncbi:MAG: hypothetical protein JSU05_12430, partial [Bacteroidetes bacterium]|nr:hypothetical protein [Bacteroidota bacterium]